MKKTIKSFFGKHPKWRSFAIVNIMLITISALTALFTHNFWGEAKTLYLFFGVPVFAGIAASNIYPEVGNSVYWVSCIAYYVPIFLSEKIFDYINWDLVLVLALLILYIALKIHYKSMYEQAVNNSRSLANRYRRVLLNYISEDELLSLDNEFGYNETKK